MGTKPNKKVKVKTSKAHYAWIISVFVIGGAAVTGLAGVGLLYLARVFVSEGLFDSISYVAAFFVSILPGIVGALYWSYFYIKRERNETKHLDDGQRKKRE